MQMMMMMMMMMIIMMTNFQGSTWAWPPCMSNIQGSHLVLQGLPAVSARVSFVTSIAVHTVKSRDRLPSILCYVIEHRNVSSMIFCRHATNFELTFNWHSLL